MICRRWFSSSIPRKSASFKILEDYPLKCGLEIHSQLNTDMKLFSFSRNSFNEPVNSQISYFDCSLPGTQPVLNPESLLLALKAAIALDSDIQLESTFDRKHYFYGDQPLGYQITQHYRPYARNGQLKLNRKFDDIDEDEKTINIEQIQLEQDTGKSTYIDHNHISKIDLNRTNIPLIEMVTKPDFTNLKQIRAFIKKFQTLLSHLNICTGDMETGAMRVDVNVSVNNGQRVEIKNLSSTSAILAAIRFEYKRQVALIQENKPLISLETRGWTGAETIKLRSKESAIDYRYMPDPELPSIQLSEDLIGSIASSLPDYPEQLMAKFINKPYNLRLKDAKFLIDNPELLQYYLDLFRLTHVEKGLPSKLAANWLLHELIGTFTKLEIIFETRKFPPFKLAELVELIHHKSITNSSAKLLLTHLISNSDDSNKSLLELIEEFDLAPPESGQEVNDAIVSICQDIISNNQDIVQDLKEGKKLGKLNYLIGQAMRACQGKINSKSFEENFKKLIGM